MNFLRSAVNATRGEEMPVREFAKLFKEKSALLQFDPSFADRYLKEHAEPRKRASSVAADRRNLKNHILPRLGHLKLDAVTRADVAKFHGGMTELPGAANRCLALVSKMLALAEVWGLRADGSNPCRHIARFPERRFDRRLSAEDFSRLGAVLRAAEANRSEHPSAIGCIRLLALTGLRRDEARTLQWPAVHLEGRFLRLGESKTGPRDVLLGAAAVDLLTALQDARGDNPHVFPGIKKDQAFVGLEKAWRRIRNLAQLPGIRLHDLRHTFGSTAGDLRYTSVQVAQMLGHRQASTAERYIHPAEGGRQQAVSRVAGAIAKQMAPPPMAEVVPLRRRAGRHK